MLVSNHQKNVNYFKQFPCYSMTTHLSQHRELGFAYVTCVEFSRKTSLRQQLPKYIIDKYQTPNFMYWLQWRTEQLEESVIVEGRKREALKGSASSNTTDNSTLSQQSQDKKPYLCLYISRLGKIAHIKLVFNYDPQKVCICQDYIYTIGGNQLIITQLWPKAVNFNKKHVLKSSQQLPFKQSQVVHQLQSGSQVMSLDFVVLQDLVVAKVIYFNDKKGYYAKTYSKDQNGSNGMQIINKIMDFTFSFKKNQQRPLLYQTLVPNILGIVVHNTKQFSLIDLTSMKLIQNTRMSLTEWQLDINQAILIRSHQNKAHEGYNDCLTISIGQGSNVEIFLYHIRFIENAHIVQQQNKRIPVCEQQRPISIFTTSQLIEFSQCRLKHFSIINLQQVTILTNYILTKNGIIYLGYNKGANSSFDLPASSQLPISGFVDYLSPFTTHQILMQENKIWKEYKFDMLFHNVFSIVKDKYKMGGNQTGLQRILASGRYEKWFITKMLGVNNISEITKMHDLENEDTFSSICQKLLFEWRNQYKFVQFVIYKQQVLVIRKNSIGSLIQIPQQQFSLQKDKLSEPQISYNQILSRGFSARYDIEGDAYMDEQFNISEHRNESNAAMSHAIFRNCRTYEEKLRSIDMMVGNYMEEGWFENGLTKEVNLGRVGNDEEQMKAYSKAYETTMGKVLYLAKISSLQSLPEQSSQSIEMGQMSVQIPLEQMLSQQSQLLLHLQVLCLKVKDQIYYLSNSLKANYQYHFNQLLSQLQNSAQKQIQSSRTVTMQLLQKTHLQHLYVVFILQWLSNIGSKSYLQSQYEYFNRDLIEQFIEQYVYKITSQNSSANNDQAFKTNEKDKKRYWKSTRQLLKSDLSIHVNNIISLMLKGLICEFNYQPHHMNVSQLIDEDIYSKGKLVVQHVKELNAKMNPFIFKLLNKQQFIKTASLFIADGLIMQLFEQLILNPVHQNLAKFMPINKTFVYSILNLPISRQRKIGILSSELESKQFQTLILLIQSENNCYMTLYQDNELCIGYEGSSDKFYENSLRLSRQNCCIIQELIVQNYKSFLSCQQILPQPSAVMPIRSQISSPEYQNYVTSYKQQRYRQFTKIFFSNIQFEYLTQAGHYNKRQQNQRMNHDEINEQNEIKSVYDSKAIVESHRLKIQEIQEINQDYTESKIQKTFSKFYSKIFKPDNKQEQSGLKRSSNGQQNGIRVESSRISLSKWQLDRINRLYLKHSRNLRFQRKSSFEATFIIQKVNIDQLAQKINLEYAMMKIYLFRLKLAFKEITQLEDNQKEKYVEIMKQCVEKIKDAIVAFKDNVAKLGGGYQMTDEKFLSMIKQTDIMQNSKVWNKDTDSLQTQAQTNPESIQVELKRQEEKWKILNLPISSEWLNLLSLTFYKSPDRTKSSVFTNYDKLESIVMKILIVVKEQNMNVEFQSLKSLFGQKQIGKIIRGNQELRKLYQSGQGTGVNTSKLSAQTSTTFRRQQPLRSNQSTSLLSGLKINVNRR